MAIPSNAVDEVIRRATPEDAEQLSALCAEHARFEHLEFVASGHVDRLRAALRDEMGLAIWVAESSGAAFGYAATTPAYAVLDAMPYLHLDCLYLRAEHRGRGTGARLLDQVAAFGASLDLPRLEWQTPAWNRAAARFYRRQGATQRAKLRFVLTLSL